MLPPPPDEPPEPPRPPRPPPELPPLRERDVVLRERFAALRGLAAPVERLAGLRVPVDLRVVADERVELPLDLAAVERLAVDRLAVERFAVERLAAGLRALPELRDVLLLPREVPDEEAELARAVDPSSLPHLPDITRCAASATASAMIEPNLVALDIMLLAACEAVSAASRPASRILRRAAGLALIAAAAAASPAASISLLIAAFASLSTVLSPPLEDLEEDLDELFFEVFAIASLPPLR